MQDGDRVTAVAANPVRGTALGACLIAEFRLRPAMARSIVHADHVGSPCSASKPETTSNNSSSIPL
jgi:hypothetical protein